MRTHFISKRTYLLLKYIFIGTGILICSSCQQKKENLFNDPQNSLKAIENLEIRINQLENRIEQNFSKTNRKNFQAPSGPIKSITFRLGTNDDRLRIYWTDGRRTDLPCLKEQAIWVCG